MIREIQIENYKSIQKLKLNLGQVTVLIGENGSGKSNILEAIALASAAANGKLDHEFLFSRGIRVTEPLFISENTPKFFAIDNIDASLNPKLCSQLMKELVELAKKYNKQVIFTTHNPAILDGLNLDDEEQKLLVIYRNKLGHTKARYVDKPEPLEGQEPVKLSEAFLRGYIGGIPRNF